MVGKLFNSPFHPHPTTTPRPLQLVHTDICGPLATSSLSHNTYFLTFIDDYIHFTIVTFLNTKSSHKFLEKFNVYHKLVTTQQGLPLKAFQSDIGREYKFNIFQDYCQSHGNQQCSL